MKKYALLVIVAFVSLTACEGPEGPPGPPGFDGEDGVNILGTILEFTGTFTDANDYLLSFSFPTSVEVFDTDVVMVYALVGNDDGDDIWEPLPQTLFINDGILLYTFDHTYFDVNVFMDGTVNLSTLSADFTDNKTFRVAIIPADAASAIDVNSFNQVQQQLNIKLGDIQTINLN
jgi:hypothetical protein